MVSSFVNSFYEGIVIMIVRKEKTLYLQRTCLLVALTAAVELNRGCSTSRGHIGLLAQTYRDWHSKNPEYRVRTQ